MCSNIVEIGNVEGYGRTLEGWFILKQAVVTFDHPLHVAAEHAINIDFVNYDRSVSSRVAVELTAESARHLIRVLESALARGDAQHLPESGTAPSLAS